MSLKFYTYLFAIVFLISSANLSSSVDLTCEYNIRNAGKLLFISGERYACNLIDEYFALNSMPSQILGEHIGSKQDENVEVISIFEKKFYEIPDLSEKFTNVLYIQIDNTPLSYLENKHLVPYAYTLIYLVIRGSKLQILEKNLFHQMVLLKTVDFRNNEIFYIHAEAFNGPSLTALLLQNNNCKETGIDVGNFAIPDNTWQEFNSKIQSSTCGSLDVDEFISTYLLTKATSDSESYISMQTLTQQGSENEELQDKLSKAEVSLKNATNLFNNISSSVSELELQISTLSTSNEQCVVKYDAANSALLELNSTISNLTSINDILKSQYDAASSTILTHESTILNLNFSNRHLKTIYDSLNQDYNTLQIHAADLERLVLEIDETAEKCREVNGTCRFTNTANGYTCIAHNVVITSPEVTSTSVSWTGTHSSTSKDKNVLALVLRDLNVLYMPTTIGSSFVNIETLTIKNCGLKKLSKGDFNYLDFLITLEITSNNIETIESGVFDSLTSLETLNLSENKIKSLLSKVFVSLSQLTSLNLDNNELTVLKADFLTTATKIEYFSAINNQIATVESSFVWKMRSAKKIDLTGNGCDLVFDISKGSYITFYSGILSKC